MNHCDKRFAGCVSTHRIFHPLWCIPPHLILFFGVLSVLTACGGGGGGGGGDVTPITHNARSFGEPISPLIWITDSAEFKAQKGLASVHASAAYSRGFSGRDVRTAIVDTGVDATHSEFNNRIFAGIDWHSNNKGLTDPYGHGTHVAAISAGARDDQGVHGIAPESHIYSYRILNTNGNFGGRSGAEMIPHIISHSYGREVMVLNNSWASTTEINDVSKSVVSNALGAELGAWKNAVKQGQVMVWAAGNDRDAQVSVRAGLPHHFPELTSGWLAVVAADVAGVEPSYTNRCGLAASWCITAPGGGDSAYYHGILSAQSGGGLVRKSGTSMAAPHVTGGLALLLDAFPTISPQQAALRLLQTATYEGLETADGCTIDSCEASEMQAVFGQGQMDVQAALQPIGTLSIADGQSSYRMDRSYLIASDLLYTPLSDAVDDIEILAYDSFDGAGFSASLGSLIFPPPASSAVFPAFNAHDSQISPAQLMHLQSGDVSAFLQTDAPHHYRYPERLNDISTQPSELVAGFDIRPNHVSDVTPSFSLHSGYAEHRQSVVVTQRWQAEPALLWLGGGLANHTQFLDSIASGGWQSDPAQEKWMFLGLQSEQGKTVLQAEWLYGQAKMQSEYGMLQQASATLSALSITAETVYSPRLSQKFSLSQPRHLEQAKLNLSPSVVLNPAHQNIALSSADRPVQIDWQLTQHFHPAASINFGLGVSGHAKTDTAIKGVFANVSTHMKF